MPLEERIAVRLRVNGECREWTGGMGGARKPEHRRPVMRKGQVSRIVWELAFGAIQKGIEVCHHCDNPKCLRTSHLFLGTHLENIADMDSKGRRVTARCERHGSSKLTWGQVDSIRQLAADGVTHRELARRYGVNRPSVTAIVSLRTWKPEYRPTSAPNNRQPMPRKGDV